MFSKKHFQTNNSTPLPIQQYLKQEDVQQKFKELKLPRFKIVLQLTNDLPQNSLQNSLSTSLLHQEKEFIPFIQERSDMGKIIGSSSRRYSQDSNVKVLNNEESQWKQRKSEKAPLKKRIKSTLKLAESPSIGQYDYCEQVDFVKYKRTPQAAFSERIFDPELLKIINQKKKKKILDQRKQELQEKKKLRQELEAKKQKKKVDLSTILAKELRLPALQRQQVHIENFFQDSKRNLQIKVDEQYVGFPKDFEQKLFEQKRLVRKLKEVKSKIRQWGIADPKERQEELKEQAKQIIAQNQRRQELDM